MASISETKTTNTLPSLISNCIVGVFFGYFALGFDSDPKSCLASPDSDVRWTAGNEVGYHDIGYSMRLVA